MCDTDVRSGSYGDPLTLLKNCDATALGKICEAVSGMAEDSTAYANFPKRSLVKCFSARDKYEWHVTQTAELEELQKRWTTYKQEMKRKKQERRQLPARHIIHEERRGAEVGTAHEGTNARRRAQHKTIKAQRQSPNPQAVNDDILREALMVAEHMEESDVPSALSSDQKCSSEESESTARIRHSRSVHPTSSMESGKGTRGSTGKPAPASSMTTPRQRQTSLDAPHDKRQRQELSPRRKTPRRPDESKVERVLSPVTPPMRSDAAATPRQRKPVLSSTKSNRPSIASSSKGKKVEDVPLHRNGRSTGVRLRGAFGACLGSKHASVDFSSSRSPADLPAHRHASTGPATRKFFGSNRLKKSPTCRMDRASTGSFGSLKFRASGGELRASLSRAWK